LVLVHIRPGCRCRSGTDTDADTDTDSATDARHTHTHTLALTQLTQLTLTHNTQASEVAVDQNCAEPV